VLLNEHILYGGEVSHAPPSASGNAGKAKAKRHYLLTRGLKCEQRAAICHVHLYLQQYWLEDWNVRDQWGDFCLAFDPARSKRKASGDASGGKLTGTSTNDSNASSLSTSINVGLDTLRVTIRHTDWWYHLLGPRSPLALDPKKAGRAPAGQWISEAEPFEKGSWGSKLIHLHGLKNFELELETIVEKKRELEDVVAVAEGWEFPLGDGKVLVWEGCVEWNWSGCAKPSEGVEAGLQMGRRRGTVSSLRGGGNSVAGCEEDGVEYVVFVLQWKSVAPRTNNPSMGDEQGGGGDERVFAEYVANGESVFGNGRVLGIRNGSINRPNANGHHDARRTSSVAPAATAQPPTPLRTRTNPRPRGRDAIPTYYG